MFFFLTNLSFSKQNHRKTTIEDAQKNIYRPRVKQSNVFQCTNTIVCPNYRNHVCDGILDLKGIASKYASLGATVEGITDANKQFNLNILNKGLIIKIPIIKPDVEDANIYMYDQEFTKDYITVNGSEILCFCFVQPSLRTDHTKCQERAEYAINVDKSINEYGIVLNLSKAAAPFNVNVNAGDDEYELRRYNVDGNTYYAVYQKSNGILYNPGKDMIQLPVEFESVAYLSDSTW